MAAVNTEPAMTPGVETLPEKFHRLAEAWQRDVAHLSSASKRDNHPAYQEIIALGPPVVPLLLRDLELTSRHWFTALSVITKTNPVAPEDAGDIRKMVQAWLDWGKQQGYVYDGPKAGDSDMEETPRETWALYLGMFATLIPALIASDFIPALNVLPFAGWLVIAGVGGGLAGAIGTSYWVRGAISGVLAGAGALFGMWLYVTIREMLLGHFTFLKIELAVGATVGAGPGLLLYAMWARQPRADANGASTGHAEE